MLAPWNSYDKPKQRIKKQRHYFADKDLYSQSYGFSSSHVWMWELDHKEGWMLKNWRFWTVMLEKTLESPLDCKEIKSVNLKEFSPEYLLERTGAEAEAPIFWLPDSKSWLIRKDPHAGNKWRQEEKGMTEDEMVEWHNWLNGHEFEPTLRDTEGQGSQACCSSLGHKVSDTTEPLNNNKMQSTSCWMNHKLESGC